jgi:hypothetical protein
MRTRSPEETTQRSHEVPVREELEAPPESRGTRSSRAIGTGIIAAAGALTALLVIGSLTQSPLARQRALFVDLNDAVASTQHDCEQLGPTLKSFFQERKSDFDLLSRVPAEQQAALEPEFVREMAALQFAMGSSFSECAENPDVAAATVAWRDSFSRVMASFEENRATRPGATALATP